MSDGSSALDSILDPRYWTASRTSPTTFSISGVRDARRIAAKDELMVLRRQRDNLKGMLRDVMNCISVEPRMDGSLGMMRLCQGHSTRAVYTAARAWLQENP